ncbi:Latrophilin-3 [Gryllus bimaculatus]|nr:Latrophilin-3 [Gryllus bimaculatus]
MRRDASASGAAGIEDEGGAGGEQARYDTAYACEGKTLKIECKEGELIHLIRANYGRFSITICNDHGNTDWSVNCMSHKSLRVLHNRCSQQQNCSILASTSMFGDPCPGTLKYLEAHYQCMPGYKRLNNLRPPPPPRAGPARPGSSRRSPACGARPVADGCCDRRTRRQYPEGGGAGPGGAGRRAPRPPAPPRPSARARSRPGPGPARPTFGPAARRMAAAAASASSAARAAAGPGAAPAETLLPHAPTTPPPAPTTADWRTTRRTTTASSTAAVESAAPPPSVTWFQESELAQLCGPVSARNLYWNWTWAGDVNVQPCPGGATGLASWRCSPGVGGGAAAAWRPASPDLSECRSVWLTSLEDRVNDGDSITSIAGDLAQVGAQCCLRSLDWIGGTVLFGREAIVTRSKTLYGGDMMTTTKIIMKMAKKMSADIQTFPDPRQREAYVTELLNGVVRTGSNLLDSAQHPSWRDLSYKEQMRVATSLLTGLEESAFLVANTVVQEKTVIQNVKNILLSVRVVKTRNVGTEQFPLPATLEVWPVSQDWLQLPRGALLENSEGGLVRLVFVAFDRLEEILQPQPPREHSNVTRVLNTKVISASLGKGRHIQLSEPVRLFLRHLITENVTNPSCVFWDYSESAWSDEGCRVEQTNHTHTLCQCNHLTNFAVLMDVHATYLTPSHQMALQIITYIGCIISVVCLVLTIVTFQLFQGLKSDRTTIHKNLCVCLLVAEILFLAGIGQTENQMVCGVVAVLLHFFFLCAFAWMFLEGFQLYVMLIEVFEAEKSRIRWYYMFAYGAPLIIVAVSCIVDLPSYGTERYCWLRADNFFIFSFVGPVIAVILANLVFLSMAIYMMCRHANASASMKSKEHSRLASARAWLRGAIVLVFLLGLTWTFGLLYLNEESVIMAYIFTVLNSLQGLFIFVFHCVQNEKVRKEYKKFIRRQSWLPKCLRCSKRSNNKERRSSLYAGSNGNPSAPNSHSTDSSALSPHGTSYLLRRGWSSRSSRGRPAPSPGPGPSRPGRAGASAAGAGGQEVEVCVATLPYTRPPSNLPKSATTWGSLHKPLMWKNISFKSYSRDSGHGGSEQEDSPRSHTTTTLNSLNNLRILNNSKDTRRQPYVPADYNQGITNDLSNAGHNIPVDSEPVSEYCHEPQCEEIPVAIGSPTLQLHVPGRTTKKPNSTSNLLRSTSPWNHTYTEIREGKVPSMSHPHPHSHTLSHSHLHSTVPEDDPVYEEIERSEIQVSDMSDEDGKRQSDVSRQSSRSYGDHRPLIPYSPAADRNFHTCLDAALKHRLKEHGRHLGPNREPPGDVADAAHYFPGHTQYLYTGENARTVAVLDGETVVCHLQPDRDMYSHNPYNSRTVLPPYSEC